MVCKTYNDFIHYCNIIQWIEFLIIILIISITCLMTPIYHIRFYSNKIPVCVKVKYIHVYVMYV